MKQTNTNTNKNVAKKPKVATTQTYVNDFKNDAIVKYPVFNSNAYLKRGSQICFANFEIVTSSSAEIDFNISCKIKTSDFEKMQNDTQFEINKNLTLKYNVFANIYKTMFIETLKDIDTTTLKHLFSKSICYTIKLAPGLANTIRYFNENNIKPTVNDLLTKQKLSTYKVFENFVYIVYDYINATNKTTK